MRPGEFKPYYFYRFVRWKLGNKNPITAVAKVTTRCNLRCKHCPWWKWDVKDVGTEKWYEALRKARKQGVIHLILEGGEPTVRKDINKIISYAKKLGMLVMMITNGTNDLSRYQPDNFWISIDGVGDVHDDLRGKGVFERVVRNIKANPKVRKMVLCTISKTNVHQLEDITAYFSDITDGIWFNFMYPYQSVSDIALSVEEQISASKEILKLKEKYNIINSRSYLSNVGKDWNCSSFLTLLIGPDTSTHRGCTVEQIEQCRCCECNMACYGELSQAINMKPDSIDFLKKSAGLEDHLLLWMKSK